MRLLAKLCACLLLVESVALKIDVAQTNGALLSRKFLPWHDHALISKGPDHRKMSGLDHRETTQRRRGAERLEQHSQIQLHGIASRTMTSISAFSKAQLSLKRILSVGFLMLIITVVLFVVFSVDDEDSPAETLTPAKSRKELAAIEDSDGTWAQTYREADEQSRLGLELLFRCHIIPTVEFAKSKVSQGHIGESVWIATHMLRQRPLEEWLEKWPEAQKTFEENATACYQARTNVHSSAHEAEPDVQTAKTSQKYIDRGDADLSPETIPVVPEQSSRPRPSDAQGGILKTPADRKSLMERCRQIMAKSDSGRKPRESQSGSRSSRTPVGTDPQLSLQAQRTGASPPSTSTFTGSAAQKTAE